MKWQTFFQGLYLVGLLIEFIGAGLLFKFGTPPYSPFAGGMWMSGSSGDEDLAQMKKTARHKKLAIRGFFWLAVGVLFQLIQASVTLYESIIRP